MSSGEGGCWGRYTRCVGDVRHRASDASPAAADTSPGLQRLEDAGARLSQAGQSVLKDDNSSGREGGRERGGEGQTAATTALFGSHSRRVGTVHTTILVGSEALSKQICLSRAARGFLPDTAKRETCSPCSLGHLGRRKQDS